MYDAFKGKVVGIMATSPVPMGGMRMLRSMQQFLQDMGAVIVPGHKSIGGAYKVFDKDGTIMDERTQSKIDAAAGQVVHFARIEANRERDCGIGVAEIQKLSNMEKYGKVDTY
jgi:NAD(P)H-dependent FMN reductase